jgi:predicted DNA-binding transcriptional regulator AlpA
MDPEIRYLNERQVAHLINRSLSTLRNERCRGCGIPYIKVGRSVRYNCSDVFQFMEQRKIKTNQN